MSAELQSQSKTHVAARSKAIIESAMQSGRYDKERLYNADQLKAKRSELDTEKEKLETKECTFAPSIKAYKSKSPSGADGENAEGASKNVPVHNKL